MSFEVAYRVHNEVLVVDQRGVAQTVEQARAFQAEVERRLAMLPARKVIFDNTKTEPPSKEVRDELHGWLMHGDRFDAAALLFESEMLALSINMQAMADRVSVKAFADFAQAHAWVSARKLAQR